MRVAVAGTFDVLHVGHRILLKRAFESGDDIVIGIVTDELAARMEKRAQRPFGERSISVKEFARTLGKRFSIVGLDDPMGPAAHGDFDAIVVSEDTLAGAEAINRRRTALGLKELSVIKVAMVRDREGGTVSSTRIKNRELDADGNLLKMSKDLFS